MKAFLEIKEICEGLPRTFYQLFKRIQVYKLLDMETEEDATLLQTAIIENDHNFVKQLIDSGAGINKIGMDTQNSLHTAISIAPIIQQLNYS